MIVMIWGIMHWCLLFIYTVTLISSILFWQCLAHTNTPLYWYWLINKSQLCLINGLDISVHY